MKISQLEYFLKVMECGSISKAAKELYISQPALTKAIASLESEFNIQLLERSSQGTRITPDGRRFSLYAINLVIAARSLQSTFSAPSSEPRFLSLATQQLDFVYDLMDDIFSSCSNTGTNIDLQEIGRGRVADYVADFRANLGLMVVTGADSLSFQRHLKEKHLEQHVLDTSGVYLCVGPASPFYECGSVSPKEASDCFHVLLDYDELTKYELLSQKNNNAINSQRMVFVNTIGAARHIIHQRGAVMYIPKWVRGLVSEDPELRIIPIQYEDSMHWENVSRLVWIKREGETLSAVEQQFIDLLQLHFQKENNSCLNDSIEP